MATWRWQIAQWAEISWWRLYLGRKKKEDYLSRKAAYWRRVLQETGLRIRPGERVLDAGCGPAGIFLVLDRQQVDAIDPLLDAYALRLPHFSPASYAHVKFSSVSLEGFRPERPYDTVCCLNAINHVADLGRALDNLTGALAAHGQLLLSVDTHNHQVFHRLFRLLPLDILHPHQYDLAEYERMLTGRGLHIERTVRLRAGFFFDYHAIVARWPEVDRG